jgi:hypothetical protein
MPKHITLAALEGPRAGLRQFEAVASKSGLPQVKRTWRKFSKLNAKGRFTLYCDTFGEQIEDAKAVAKVTRPVKASKVQADRKVDAIQAIVEGIAALQGQLDALLNEDTDEPAAAKPKKATSKKSAKLTKNQADVGRRSNFSLSVVEALGLPTKVGRTFTYTSKHGKSTWKVEQSSKKSGITAVKIAA